MRKYRWLMYLFLLLTILDLGFYQKITNWVPGDFWHWTFFFTAIPTVIFWALGTKEAEQETLFKEEIKSC